MNKTTQPNVAVDSLLLVCLFCVYTCVCACVCMNLGVCVCVWQVGVGLGEGQLKSSS